MSEKMSDGWAAQADLYSSQASRLTELHGADLVTLIKDDIVKTKMILEIGCGTGAFAKAYLQQFPKGVPGQTLILSDFSDGMLQKARETVKPSSEFATKIVFQHEDGTKLEGIEDGSIDIVVSLFGVFLIDDQESTLKAIQRVLKKEKHSLFANGSWMFDVSDYFSSHGFGVSLQDVFSVPTSAIDPARIRDHAISQWGKKESIKDMFAGKTDSVELYQALHTSVWEYETLWTMLEKNPMSGIQDAAEVDIARAKQALLDFLTKHGCSVDKPLMLSTASILCLARAFGSSG